MRFALPTLLALALSVSTALAEPAEPPANDEPAEKAQKAKKPAAKKTPKAAKKTPDLRVKPGPRDKAIDLFPAAVLGKTKAEKRPGLSLGNDGDWKVQAAQVGAMAAIFGALVGLCGSGNCMVPKAVTDPLPSWLKAKPHHVNDPRPPQKLPNLR